MISFTDGVRGVYHMWAALAFMCLANALPARADSFCVRSNVHFDQAEIYLDGLDDGFFS